MGRFRNWINSQAGTTGLKPSAAMAASTARGAGVGTGKVVLKTVNVTAGQTSGTATVVTGSIIWAIYPAGNQDQLVDNVAISGTTLTVTLAAAATAQNNFRVTVLEP